MPARSIQLVGHPAPGRVRRAATGVLLVVVAGVAACAPADPATRPGGDLASPSVAPVVRSVLAEAIPDDARNLDLQLVRYIIQPGTTLATHHHPGTQVAMIESGRLTYTVVSGGDVVIHQLDGGTRTVRPGSTDVIVAGEWIVEREPVIHFGANNTSEVVTILATTLLQDGQPAAITDATPAPSRR